MESHRKSDEIAALRMGAVKTTPPPGTEEASFGAEMAAMPDPHGAPGMPITLGQAIQDLTEQREYGISPAEEMRKAFDEAASKQNVYEKVHAAQQEEAVNSPAHYNEGGIECIDAIATVLGPEGFRAMCHGNALKYLWRARHKGAFEQDMKKAVWYLRMSIGDDPRETPAKVAQHPTPGAG